MGRINTALITLFGQDINKGDGSRQIGNAVVGGSAATAVTLPYRSHFARQKAARLSLAAVGFLRYGKAKPYRTGCGRAALLRRPQIRRGTRPVVIVALHFPAFGVELPAGTALEACSVRLSVQRKGSAHFLVPAPE